MPQQIPHFSWTYLESYSSSQCIGKHCSFPTHYFNEKKLVSLLPLSLKLSLSLSLSLSRTPVLYLFIFVQAPSLCSWFLHFVQAPNPLVLVFPSKSSTGDGVLVSLDRCRKLRPPTTHRRPTKSRLLVTVGNNPLEDRVSSVSPSLNHGISLEIGSSGSVGYGSVHLPEIGHGFLKIARFLSWVNGFG